MKTIICDKCKKGIDRNSNIGYISILYKSFEKNSIKYFLGIPIKKKIEEHKIDLCDNCFNEFNNFINNK